MILTYDDYLELYEELITTTTWYMIFLSKLIGCSIDKHMQFV